MCLGRHPLDRQFVACARLEMCDRSASMGIAECIGLEEKAPRPGQRVPCEKHATGLAGRIDLASHAKRGLDGQFIGLGAGGPECIAHGAEGRENARSGEDVVKLVEENPPPGFSENRRGEVALPRQGRGHLRRFGSKQALLRTPVELFDLAGGGVATTGVVLQVAAPGRDCLRCGRLFDRRKILRERGQLEPGQCGIVLESDDALQVFAGRAAAMVADAEKEYSVVKAGRKIGLPMIAQVFLQLVCRGLGRLAVLPGDSLGEHARAVGAFPPEKIGHIRRLPRIGTHEDIVREPGAPEKLGKPSGVSEGIDIVTDRGRGTGLGPEPRFAVKALPDKALGGGQIAIGLLDPAADDFPAPLADQSADLRIKPRIHLLEPSIGGGGCPGEFEFREFRGAIHRALNGGEDFGCAIGPRPQPDGINVRLRDEVECFHECSSFCNRASRKSLMCERRLKDQRWATGPSFLSSNARSCLASISGNRRNPLPHLPVR